MAPAETRGHTTRVVLSVPEELGEEHHRKVYVDPGSGRVQGALTTWFGSTPLRTWFDDLHRNLQLGEPGRVYSELAASWLWVLALGGVVLWVLRPGSVYRTRGRWWRALLPDRSAREVRATRSWHAAIGVWLFVGLLFLSATGLTWSTYAGGRFGALLRAAGLDGPVEITPPPDAGSGWVVAQTDEVWPVRQDQVLLAALAIGLLAAIFFGCRMWWQRRPTRDGARALVGRPLARGAWRGVSRAGVAAIALATVAVAWAVPLLGISLAGFLLIDLAIGTRHRRVVV